MESDNNNDKVGGNLSALSLLEEAKELARSRNWTRDLALYIMFCKAMGAGDKVRAEAIIELLEPEVMKSLVDKFKEEAEKENDQDR
jgi:hypothetical protein